MENCAQDLPQILCAKNSVNKIQGVTMSKIKRPDEELLATKE
jgi:hypothetical protein